MRKSVLVGICAAVALILVWGVAWALHGHFSATFPISETSPSTPAAGATPQTGELDPGVNDKNDISGNTPPSVDSRDNNLVKQQAQSNEFTFNFIFKYGFEARNILNTFEGTYTKDMVMDPPITTKLSLTKEELNTINNKMVEIDFFSYPDVFTVPVKDDYVFMITPYENYYFKVQHGSKIKELYWEDSIKNQNSDADRLRELIKCIQEIAESKSEYKKLPPPRGGYD